MKYVIYGASLETGADCKVIVEAATPIGATEQAQAMRIAVSRVELEEAAVPVSVTGTALTERTGKPIKRQMLSATIGMLAALGGCVVAPQFGPDYGGMIVIGCTILFVASVVGYFVARYKAWWHHG